jgi:hypothetical protein
MNLTTSFTKDQILGQRTKFANQTIKNCSVKISEVTTSEKGNSLVVLSVQDSSQKLKAMSQQILEALQDVPSLNLYTEDAETKVISFNSDIVFNFSCSDNWQVTINPITTVSDNSAKIKELKQLRKDATMADDEEEVQRLNEEIFIIIKFLYI